MMLVLILVTFIISYYFYRRVFIRYNELTSTNFKKTSFVIVGGASGLGRQIAEDLILTHKCSNVIIVDVQTFTPNLQNSVIYLKCDISKRVSVASILPELTKSIDVIFLVNYRKKMLS